MCPLTRKECYQLNSNPRDPAGIRTQDPYIKSVLLYQLSYGIIAFLIKTDLNYFCFCQIVFLNCGAKLRFYKTRCKHTI